MRFSANDLDRSSTELAERADLILLGSAVAYGAVGLAAGVIVNHFVSADSFVIAIVGAVLGGATGYAIGRQKAFEIRLRAQMIACLMAIEASVRRT
jgi:FtsH-binding integral membrane protein